MSIVDRILQTARQQGYTQVALAEGLKHCHITKQTITDWKAGKSNSYYAIITDIAAFLNVTAEYLLTGVALQPEEEAVLKQYRSLSQAGRQKLLQEAERLVQEEALCRNAAEILEDKPDEKENPSGLTPEMRKRIMAVLEEY